MNIEHSVLEVEALEASNSEPTGYEAPVIESVLTPDSLEREVHYAGVIPASGAASN